jgi:hypothetical protein
MLTLENNIQAILDANIPDIKDEIKQTILERIMQTIDGSHPVGEWIVSGVTTHYYRCSECGSAGDSWDKFCRSCGASMIQHEVRDDIL